MYIYRPPYENELMHYGIPGQKWGVRRFQNPDGTLTNAGKERYDGPSAFQTDQYAKKVASRSDTSMGSSGIKYSWGGGYLTPRWVTDKTAYANIDRAKEWLTGNRHEAALNTVLNTGYGNQKTQEYILKNVYGYTTEQIYEQVIPETIIPENIVYEQFVQEEIDAAVDDMRRHGQTNDPSDLDSSSSLQAYKQNKETIDAIVKDYRTHTLPGLIDSMIDKGKSLVKKLFGTR